MILFEYTAVQHFQFGYESRGATRWLTHRQSKDEKFVARYGRAQTQCDTWREANQMAAELILSKAELHGLVPLVLYSGGLDSEIVLLSMLEANRRRTRTSPIHVATLELTPDINKHDVQYVEKFKARLTDLGFDKNDIVFHRESLNPLEFWKSDSFFKLAEETQTVSPMILCHLWLCDKLHDRQLRGELPPLLPIIGQGEIHLVKSVDESYEPGVSPYAPSPWSLSETENLCGIYRFFISRNRPAIPGFFQYLPEQFETQLRTNRVIHELVANMRVGKLGTRTSKPEILAHDYWDLEERPKYTGFEPIAAAHDSVRAELGSRMPECEGHWYRDVFDIYRDLVPLSDGPLMQGDWIAAFGRDGEIHFGRGSQSDVFATEWRPEPELLGKAWKASLEQPPPLASILARLKSEITQLIASQKITTFIHDGSFSARLVACIAPELDAVLPASTPRLSNSEIFQRCLALDLDDTESLFFFTLCETLRGRSILVPHLPFRMTPERVWLESEKIAKLTSALQQQFGRQKLAAIWTRSEIATSAVQILALNHSRKESAREILDSVIFKNLVSQTETAEQKDIAERAAKQLEAVKRRIQGALDSFVRPFSPAMSSAYHLERAKFHIGDGLESVRAAAQRAGLESISTDAWLREAQQASPGLLLESNLFFQQEVSGLALLKPAYRMSVAIKDDNGEEVAWAHVHIVRAAPSGILQIRGVTTRADKRGQGFARKLLLALASEISQSPDVAKDFSSVQVWAAPEIVAAFLNAGFQSDTSRTARAEQVLNPVSGKLEEGTRKLTPLILKIV